MIPLRCFFFGCLIGLLFCTPVAAQTGPVKVLFIGDSLTAGLGVMKEEAYPALIQDRFDREIPGAVQVINGGISGSTTAGAYARLKWYLRVKPDVLVLALGANDGLRGLPVEEMRANLAKAMGLAKEKNISVVLCGMEVPPNYGPEYAEGFRTVFPDLAREFDTTLVPFLLEGVGGRPELNQADGIHPTSDGHKIIADTVFPFIKELL